MQARTKPPQKSLEGKEIDQYAGLKSGQDQAESRNRCSFRSVLWKVKPDLSCGAENEKHVTIAEEPEASKLSTSL